MRIIPPRLLAATLVVAAPHAAPVTLEGQRAPVIRLTTPEAELPEPFSVVAGVRELRDGRVVVVDSREREVRLADFATGFVAPIGRSGSGPGEYRTPLAPLALPGDSTAIYDGGNSRLLIILPNGVPGPVLPLPAARQESAAGGAVLSRYIPSRSDRHGRFYRSFQAVTISETGPRFADSAALERWDRATGTVDTLAFLRTGHTRTVTGSTVPFAVNDQWAVEANGRVAILRHDDYGVAFISPLGVRSRTTQVPYERIRVTEAHRREWREQQGEAVRRVAMASGGQVRIASPSADPAWPEVFPPFPSRPAEFAPDGILWVRRHGPAGAPPTYDLIDPGGRLVRQVVLPHRSRVVGFGAGSIYVTRMDEDDLQYLQRFALSAVRP